MLMMLAQRGMGDVWTSEPRLLTDAANRLFDITCKCCAWQWVLELRVPSPCQEYVRYRYIMSDSLFRNAAHVVAARFLLPLYASKQGIRLREDKSMNFDVTWIDYSIVVILAVAAISDEWSGRFRR